MREAHRIIGTGPQSRDKRAAALPESSGRRLRIIASMSHEKPEHTEQGVGEFELIARLAEVIDADLPDEPGLLVGIGDDTAVATRPAETNLYTTDTLVDGVHFRAGEIPWFDLGWKSIAVNQSDIAAMGGRPLHALVTLGVPPGMPAGPFVEAYRGMRAVLKEHGGRITGGDVVRSPVLFITVALTGIAVVPEATAADARLRYLGAVRSDAGPDAAVLRRDRAVPGDQVAVTGSLGASAGGMRCVLERLEDEDAERLTRAHFRPVPRVRRGQILAVNGVRSAMDVSDGLVDDAGKLAKASGVDIAVFSSLVPVDPILRRVFPADALTMALGGGEDYELLFTAPSPVMSAVLPRLKTPATVIGAVITADGEGGRVFVLDDRGREVELARGGWDHLRD